VAGCSKLEFGPFDRRVNQLRFGKFDNVLRFGDRVRRAGNALQWRNRGVGIARRDYGLFARSYGISPMTADRSLVPLTVVLKLGPCVSKTQRIVTCITADSR
jgi:hypothetical protein